MPHLVNLPKRKQWANCVLPVGAARFDLTSKEWRVIMESQAKPKEARAKKVSPKKVTIKKVLGKKVTPKKVSAENKKKS